MRAVTEYCRCGLFTTLFPWPETDCDPTQRDFLCISCLKKKGAVTQKHKISLEVAEQLESDPSEKDIKKLTNKIARFIDGKPKK